MSDFVPEDPLADPDATAASYPGLGHGPSTARNREPIGQALAELLPVRPCTSLEVASGSGEHALWMARALPQVTWAPSEATVDGLAAVEAWRARCPDLADRLLLLITGYGYAWTCAPRDGLSLDDKMAVNRTLLASGAPIGAMKVVRKHLSRVKGGQLAATCHPAQLLSLLISDVPGDDPGQIASGPTVGESSTPNEARAILERHGIAVPQAVDQVLDGPSYVIAPSDTRLPTSQTRVIAAPSQSLAAVAGCAVRILGDALEGEARDLGAEQARMAMRVRSKVDWTGQPLLLLSGGECTVTRRGSGTGGPNAEFVLAAALAFDGHPRIHVLACDIDGVEGAAGVASACVGPDCLNRAARDGLDAGRALSQNDAHSFFGALGGQIVTGPTLTNVNDFRAILILPQR